MIKEDYFYAIAIFAVLVVCLSGLEVMAQSEFQADSVYQHIHYLSETIGPRPMGSEQERRGLEWVRDKFISYGADTAYVLWFTQCDAKDRYLNTHSGTAVGIFKGESDTCMVIGSHMDSTPAASPGANDNASGTATAIELARLWSQRPRHYTMVFTSFGGEEQGLYGSQVFIDTFDKIDKTALMLCLDMTGSDDDIVTLMETDAQQAPKWLVRDAFSLDRKLGINRLRYPTHFATLNNIGENAGSDHEPFLKKKIPAMDFTAGINNSPIHSAQDRIAYIDRNMLAACGHLVDGLVQKYQSHYLPPTKWERYMLWRPGGLMLFIPHWLLRLLVLFALLGAGWAYFHSRRTRPIIEKTQRVPLAGLKLALLLVIIAVISQLGEALMQALKGVRYPWYVHVDAYLWLMLIWAIAGLWTALRISRHWRWSEDPHTYASRTIILYSVLTLLSAIADARLATYPAVALLFFSIAVVVPVPALKLLSLLAVPLPMSRLVFSEAVPFIARNLCQAGLFIDSFFKAALFFIVIIMALVLLYLPSIYAAAYGVIRIPTVRKALRHFRRPISGLIVAVALVMVTRWTFRLPAYNEIWRPQLVAEAEYEMRKREGKITLRSNEYFRDATVENDTFKLVLSGRKHVEKLPLHFAADWVTIDGTQMVRNGDWDTVTVNWRLDSVQPWYAVTLSLTSDTLKLTDVSSPLRYRHKDNRVTFTWRHQPPQTLAVQARMAIHPRARLIRKITATYTQLPLTLSVSADGANIYYRTTVTVADTLRLSDDIDRADGGASEGERPR